MNEDTKPAVTDWIPGHIKPVREGVYEMRSFDPKYGPIMCIDVRRLCWLDGRWRYLEGPGESLFQPDADGGRDFQWRGLASDPAQPADPKREPREWMRWAVLIDGGLTAFTYPTRRWARSAARGSQTSARVIRVRVTEI
jgi:hypothetical protein